MKILKWIGFIPLAIISSLIVTELLTFIINDFIPNIHLLKVALIELIGVAVFLFVSITLVPKLNKYVYLIIYIFILLPNLLGAFIHSNSYIYLFSITNFKFSFQLLLDLLCLIAFITYYKPSVDGHFWIKNIKN
tara:strand:+ start:137 stop:538 length:402 start_codon:yes stop_codon:yes gene_type:complete